MMAVTLGSLIIGSEGSGVWYVYSSPISANSLVKAKSFFVAFFSLAITVVCLLIGVFLAFPSLEMVAIGVTEAVLLVFSLSMVSLSFGIKGADFTELPRPRMIRPMWSLIDGISCILLAFAIVSPVIPYGLKIFFAETQISLTISLPELYLYVALFLSGIIASAIAYVFHRKAVKNAEEFLLKEEA
jgi:small-conductance mechanosensitive channel